MKHPGQIHTPQQAREIESMEPDPLIKKAQREFIESYQKAMGDSKTKITTMIKPYVRGIFRVIKTEDKKQPYKVQVFGTLTLNSLISPSCNTWVTIGHCEKLERARTLVHNLNTAFKQ